MTDAHEAGIKGVRLMLSSLGNRLLGRDLWPGSSLWRSCRNTTCEEWRTQDCSRGEAQTQGSPWSLGWPHRGLRSQHGPRGIPSADKGPDFSPWDVQSLGTGCSWGGGRTWVRQHPSAEGNPQGKTTVSCEQQCCGKLGAECLSPRVGIWWHTTVSTLWREEPKEAKFIELLLYSRHCAGYFL